MYRANDRRQKAQAKLDATNIHFHIAKRQTGHLRALLNYPQSYAPILPLIAKSTLHSMHLAFESAASIR